MALVSISEAARLTGKSRTTVQSYIKQGKLTKSTDSSGTSKLETSELLRVFGSFTGQKVGSEQSGSTVQNLAGDPLQLPDQILQHENLALKAEVELFTKPCCVKKSYYSLKKTSVTRISNKPYY